MNNFLGDIKKVYGSANKSAAEFMYLANAVMAYDDYHEKFKQIGTKASENKRWVESPVLKKGVARLQQIMKHASTYRYSADSAASDNFTGSVFEREMSVQLPPNIIIRGRCDWVGEGLSSPGGEAVDLLEIKFVNELSDQHRLQVLIYCALLAIERSAACSGMLFNARTSELEVVKIDAAEAFEFLAILCISRTTELSESGAQGPGGP
mmetsp:Transcript_21229/g.52308  ORF Transcript_21229/g.52308 Transcript_21229/m.52308 type:complete len:208 (+) Transcript_21229:564-1187(+)